MSFAELDAFLIDLVLGISFTYLPPGAIIGPTDEEKGRIQSIKDDGHCVGILFPQFHPSYTIYYNL